MQEAAESSSMSLSWAPRLPAPLSSNVSRAGAFPGFYERNRQ